jgi:hypothetical protein
MKALDLQGRLSLGRLALNENFSERGFHDERHYER